MHRNSFDNVMKMPGFPRKSQVHVFGMDYVEPCPRESKTEKNLYSFLHYPWPSGGNLSR